MTTLAETIRTTALVDTHEHQQSEEKYVSEGPDVLQALFGDGYQTSEMIVAGADPEAVKRAVDTPEGTIGARFAAIECAWHACQYTGYGEALRRTAKIVYGLDRITADGLEAAQETHAALRRPGERLRLLRDVAGLEYIDVDHNDWSCPVDRSGPDFFLYDISWETFSAGTFDTAKLAEHVGFDISDLAGLREAMAAIYAGAAANAVAVKSQHAYSRTLAWRERSDTDVAPLFQRHRLGQLLSPEERNVLGDWCIARGVELAIQHDLPFKIHTGHLAGHSYMTIEGVRPANLAPLLAKYPRARFVLMHAGYPFGHELLSLMKHFPNVYGDMCWAWGMNPRSSAEFLRQALHGAPINKLFVFGGDVPWPMQTVGYADQCRAWMTFALQAEVDDGHLSEAEAIDVAQRIMRRNQFDCFNVESKRESLRRANEAPVATRGR